MSQMGLTEQDMRNMVNNAGTAKSAFSAPEAVPVPAQNGATLESTQRRILVFGCGDAGGNVASAIRNALTDDECFVVAYNTSNRNLPTINADMKLKALDEDGAGRMRDLSKNIFRRNVGKNCMRQVKQVIESAKEAGRKFSYILVVSTTDGGTGSGIAPGFANALARETDVPVIIVGIYPSMTEDTQALYNTLTWQNEVTSYGLANIILDNNISGIPKPQVHTIVNNEAVSIASMLVGRYFGNSTINIIDSQDFNMLLSQVGGRIVIASSTVRPQSQQTLDEYLETLLANCHQPAPVNGKGLGVFLKAPKEMLSRMDTAIMDFREKYVKAQLKYDHIEESKEIRVGVIVAGCVEPVDRLKEIKSRYDDDMAEDSSMSSVISNLLDGVVSPVTIKSHVVATDSVPDIFGG